jgi:hypothetical protein
METTPKITIEDLAVKLNGKIWTKGDLKRIYLDRGYNTKKMSTKTYVEETSEGNFNVKCFVECPSQDYNWCKSQANQVIESVDAQINEILVKNSLKVLEVAQGKTSINAYVSKNGEEAQWYCERVFLEVFGFELEEILEDMMISWRNVNVEELILEAVKQSGNTKEAVSEIITKMVSKFDTDYYGILSKINGFALYICYNYNGYHPITVVMNDRTKDIGYLHHSGGFLTFTGEDWMGTDTYTNLDVISQNYFHSND